MSAPVKQQQLMRLMKSQGLTHQQIAERFDVPKHTVVNILHGRVKGTPAPRTDKGTSRHDNMTLLVSLAKETYFQQGKKKWNLSACIDVAVSRAMLEHGIVIPKDTVKRHVYKAAKKERWDIQYASLKQQHSLQSFLPKLRHDYWNALQYNDFWVIDGRKSDLWVVDDETGKMFMPQGFYIMELRTARYLHVSLSDKAFNANQVMMALIETALEHGPPTLGILCDNGMEQIGQENVLAMEQFWPREMIELYRTGSGVKEFHAIYPEVLSPVVTSLPRIPTEFGKARLERSFKFVQERLDAFIGGHGYQGGSRFDVVHTTLNRTPVKDNTFISFSDYQAFMVWFLTSTEPHNGLLPYSMIERPYMFAQMTQETGLVPTIQNALDVAMLDHKPREIPAENYYQLFYHSLPRFSHKKVKKIHQVEFRHKGRDYTYYSTDIPYTMVGEYVDVVPDPKDDTRAAIFKRGEVIAIARDINRSNITIGEKKELLARIRKHGVQQVHADSKQHKQRPVQPPATEAARELTAIEIQASENSDDALTFELLQQQHDDMMDDELPDATAEILQRIKSHTQE